MPAATEAPAVSYSIDVTEPDTDLSTLTKAELVGLAEEQGVSSEGTKADIRARLEDGG